MEAVGLWLAMLAPGGGIFEAPEDIQKPRAPETRALSY
jgi:hypothetical protein